MQSTELVSEINKDLARLYPTGADEFFEQPRLRTLMLDILFVWAREHADTSYRQGMHELLAPLVFAMHAEQVGVAGGGSGSPGGKAAEAVPTPVLSVLASTTVASAQEADLYWLFSALLEELECLFCSSAEAQRRDVVLRQRRQLELFGDGLAADASGGEGPGADAAPIQRLCHRIQNERVRRVDPALHRRMSALGIQAQVYAMKWVRLMFGREFHLEDVLVLWDGVFAMRAHGGYGLLTSVEWIAVAMVRACCAGLCVCAC